MAPVRLYRNIDPDLDPPYGAGFWLHNSNEHGHNVITAIAENHTIGFLFQYSPTNTLVNGISRASVACWAQDRPAVATRTAST